MIITGIGNVQFWINLWHFCTVGDVLPLWNVASQVWIGKKIEILKNRQIFKTQFILAIFLCNLKIMDLEYFFDGEKVVNFWRNFSFSRPLTVILGFIETNCDFLLYLQIQLELLWAKSFYE